MGWGHTRVSMKPLMKFLIWIENDFHLEEFYVLLQESKYSTHGFSSSSGFVAFKPSVHMILCAVLSIAPIRCVIARLFSNICLISIQMEDQD